jgi:hypothetical protein
MTHVWNMAKGLSIAALIGVGAWVVIWVALFAAVDELGPTEPMPMCPGEYRGERWPEDWKDGSRPMRVVRPDAPQWAGTE